MKILIISDQPDAKKEIAAIATRRCGASVFEALSLQAAIEMLETQKHNIALLICDYRGGSRALLQCLLAVSPKIPAILILEKRLTELSPVPREALLEILEHGQVPAGLEQLLERLKNDGLFSDKNTPDSEYVRIATMNLNLAQPLQADIYLRLAPHRYCKRFKKGDGFDSADLKTHFVEKGIDAFYLRKEDSAVLFGNHTRQLDRLSSQANPDPKTVREASAESLEIIHDVVEQLGFTPQIQELAKKTVDLTLQAMGQSPNLSSILQNIQANQGKYIASHSVMLAEIACAISYRIGWSGAAVFLKLTLGAFLHDLTLKDNALARFKTLEQLAQSPVFCSAQVAQEFKFHPVKAAEFARQIVGIPPEIDAILLQHHELPDGSGFPRGLYHHQLNPISCVFIVAHEMLHYFLELVPTNSRKDMIQAFLHENQAKYSEGTFLKIFDSLKTGTPITFAKE